MQKADAVIAGLTVLFGLWVVKSGFDFGYMQGHRPGSGFFPVLVGAGLAILGTINVWRSLAGIERIDTPIEPAKMGKVFAIISLVALFILSINYFGMILGSGLLIIGLGLFIRPSFEWGFLLRLLIVAVSIPIVAYFIFVVNLGVRIIPGPFGF